MILTVSQFQVDVDARWCGRTAAQLMIKMIFSEINLLLLTPSMTLIKSLTTGSSTETVEKSSLRSLCCRVEPASASDRRVNVTVLSVTLYLFFYSSRAKRYLTVTSVTNLTPIKRERREYIDPIGKARDRQARYEEA